jgi:23S rRNA (pseudouridine1915-N3)-methyltransferase
MISKIRLICIGKVKERYLQEGINEFLKRLTPYCKIEIIELKDRGIEKDSEMISEYINDKSYLLDANGTIMSSEEFAEFIKRNDGGVTFIIGGPDGFSEELKKKCKKISLSKMTFLHEMARLILLEQIYRGFMIINNRNYHK